ncbi:hypothetical protein OESDEN_02256 [Oesophagostomum dentatum]|uniref:MARVEL domain-containing protein n=1 Tax=Oesophagostomum dentatum TaxID=61180 RepID=A0A0B1TNU6_OESDE|nr:hypothetical protein OESDEN_02256 [Oesophagostomum dentatum]
MKSQKTMLKFVELVVSAASLVLITISRPAWTEKNAVLIICSVAVFGSFAFLIAYVFAVDELISSTPWFILETAYCTVIAVALISCALVLIVLTASYWADVNPLWQAKAALTAVSVPSPTFFCIGSTLVCSLLHIIDGFLLAINWKRYSWDPNREEILTVNEISF